MPIEVFQIENLFWEPGSYRQPNALPSKFKDQKVFRNIPQLYDMQSGSIALIGDHWNWCKYEGIYYILKRSTPLDIRRKKYLYHMVRDPWANTVLSGRIVVKGDISIWNQDKELRKHLNRTFPIIERPAAIARICFNSITPDWKNKLSYIEDSEESTIKLIKEKIPCPVLVEKHRLWIQEKARQSAIFKEISETLFPARKDIYILGTILPSYLKYNWKEKVKEVCNDALKELLNNPRRIIGKVSQSQMSTNKLAGHYCVTYDQEGIGNVDSGVELLALDLSNVTDVKRISWSTLEPVNPDRILDENTGIMETESNDFDFSTSSRVYKLARKAYLPLNNPRIGTRNTYNIWFREWRFNDVKGQEVKIKTDQYSEDKISYFYWVDKIDFQLSWYLGSQGYYTWRDYAIAPIMGTAAAVGTVVTGGLLLPAMAGTLALASEIKNIVSDVKGGNWESIPSTLYGLTLKLYDTEIWRKYISLVYWKWGDKSLWTDNKAAPFFPRNVKETNEFSIWNKFKRRTPSYGMLMFQVDKKWDEWERCVYLGRKKKDELQVYCGIKRSEFIKRFKDRKNEWWSNVSGPLKRICKEETVSKFFLDYYQLNFLNFVPTRGDSWYEYTQHKCDYTDEYEIQPYLYGQRNCEVTRFLNSQEFKRPSGERLENPWRPDVYGNFWYPREEDRYNFLLTAPLKLKQPLERGDFLISDLEYQWRGYNTNWWKPNVSQWKKHVLTEDWATYTMNLLEDFLEDNKGLGWYLLEENDRLFDDVEKKIYLCTDLDGNVGFKTAYKFTERHQLCTDDDQMVTSVDGSTIRQTTYWHFKGTGISIAGEEDRNLTRKLIGTFYKQLGYSVLIDDAAVYWDFLKPDEVTGDPEGHLFDLVGSDWYAFIRKDKVHFILKDPRSTLIKGLVTEAYSFDKPERVTVEGEKKSDFQILNELTLTQKINQICTFHHKTYSFPMKSKFLFTYEKEPLEPSIRIEDIETKDRLKLHDHSILTLSNAYDRVDEPIALPAKTTMVQNMGDKIMYERARREQIYADEDYYLRRQQLGLGQQVVEAEARRAQWDLDMKAYNKRWSMALDMIGIAGSLFRAGSAPFAAALKGATSLTHTAKASLPVFTTEELHDYAGFGATEFSEEGGLSDIYEPANRYMSMTAGHKIKGFDLHKPFKKMRKVERALGIGGKGGVMGSVAGIIDAQHYLTYVHPEMSKRVEEDKRFATQDIMYKLYQNDYAHFRRRQDAALKIDGLVHTWTREYPSAVEIEEVWQTRKNVKGTYLSVQYPSEEQTYYLEEYRREFGVACDIPNQVIALTSGMSENIICFRNIDDEGIVGVNNEFDREWLREKLLAGVKIVDAEQLALPYDYFDHNLIVPSVIKDDESLLKVVDELKKELEQCKKQGKATSNYWIKNFDVALKKIKDDADNPDKLKEDIESVKKEIAFAEQNPENYDQEVIALYKRLLEALETEYEQVLKIIKDRKDLEAAVKRADDAENERDDLREQITKSHDKQRELIEAKEKLEKECNETKAAAANALAAKEAEAEKAKTDLNNTKRQLLQVQNDLSRCRSTTFDVSTQVRKTVKCWTYCDFLRTFHELGWDENAMYSLLIKVPFYGFAYGDFINEKGIPTLQAIQQTVEECEELLDNNTSFIPQDNDKLREYLLTEEGAEKIRSMKRWFIHKWAVAWNVNISENELEDRRTWKTRNSNFYKKSIGWVYPNNAHPQSYFHLRIASTVKYTYEYYSWTRNNNWIQGKGFWQDWSNMNKEPFCVSFTIAERFAALRYGTSGDKRWWLFDECIYNSPGYYDFPSKNSPAWFLWIAIYWIDAHLQNTNNTYKIIKKQNSSIFNTKFISMSNPSYWRWKYGGFTNRKFYLGYLLVLADFLAESIYGKNTSVSIFYSCCETVSTGNLALTKRWLNKLGVSKMDWEAKYLYQMKISYEALCTDKSFDDAQREMDTKLFEIYGASPA